MTDIDTTSIETFIKDLNEAVVDLNNLKAEEKLLNTKMSSLNKQFDSLRAIGQNLDMKSNLPNEENEFEVLTPPSESETVSPVHGIQITESGKTEHVIPDITSTFKDADDGKESLSQEDKPKNDIVSFQNLLKDAAKEDEGNENESTKEEPDFTDEKLEENEKKKESSKEMEDDLKGELEKIKRQLERVERKKESLETKMNIEIKFHKKCNEIKAQTIKKQESMIQRLITEKEECHHHCETLCRQENEWKITLTKNQLSIKRLESEVQQLITEKEEYHQRCETFRHKEDEWKTILTENQLLMKQMLLTLESLQHRSK